MLKKAPSLKAPRWFVALALGGASVLLAVSASAASASAPSRSTTAHKSIILLRDQSRSLPVRSAAHAAAVRAEQAPIVAYLHESRAHVFATLGLVNAVVASVTPREASVLAADPSVAHVFRDGTIPGPNPLTSGAPIAAGARSPAATHAATPPSAYCGTSGSPELDPEALSNINATPAQLGSIDGSGVKVAYVADGIDPTNPDFQRNAAYGTGGDPVLTQADFTGDGSSAPTPGGEAFGDASSIAAQGNTTYDLSNFVNAAHALPSGCDIKIVGVAPGVDLLGLKVFSNNNDTTESGFLQAINYAVANGVKVLNESFGANQFPDTALDVTRAADDAAVAAGVTVVVSTGDGGITSTIGSPATDPNVISVGASTSFRSYAQNSFGGINDPNANGNFVDNNISSLSSGGFSQSGQTLDLVAPGDLNWALCSSDISHFADCTDESGAGSPIEQFGGTSESSPLTAGAAADVIQAYAQTHAGADPSPALVKQILMSTATDLGAPATEQGAGLLNVLAAVNEAESIQGTTGTPQGGLLLSPSQIDTTQSPDTISFHTVHLTNTGSSPLTVQLSSRALPDAPTSTQNGSFCMQPGTATGDCPANTGTFPIWSGVTEVYQDVNFTVPASTGPSVLKFAADYPFTQQTSLLHFALLEPDGTYAAYSLPQGLGDFGQVDVTNPPPGAWTAVFFTEQDGATPGGIGTSGTVQWSADEFTYGDGGTITPSSLTVAPGATDTAVVDFVTPTAAGDAGQSLVFSTGSATSTIPVVVRTKVPTSKTGGSFTGVLTGGNGRSGTEAQTSTYQFNVPARSPALSASLVLADDPNDTFDAFLVDPSGRTDAYSSNVTTDNFGIPVSTTSADLYVANPTPGTWSLLVNWANPVSGLELSEPFSGTISFRPLATTSNLPHTALKLKRGATYRFRVTIQNNGTSPEAYFVDPRQHKEQSVRLADQNGSDQDMTLPLPPGFSFPYYVAPPDSARLSASISGSVPVSFDMEYFPGDPDVAPGVNGPGVSSSVGTDSAALSLTGAAASPGLWLVNPDEIGPFGAGGEPAATASESLVAVTQAFDPTVTSSTGDFWSAANGITNTFSPAYVPRGDSVTITVTIRPTARVGSKVSGTLYLDDTTLGQVVGAALPDGDQLAALPYSYTVK